MSNTVYVLWFEQERDDCDDRELFIGVYSSEPEAEAAIERVKDQKGFADFPAGFHITHTRSIKIIGEKASSLIKI